MERGMMRDLVSIQASHNDSCSTLPFCGPGKLIKTFGIRFTDIPKKKYPKHIFFNWVNFNENLNYSCQLNRQACIDMLGNFKDTQGRAQLTERQTMKGNRELLISIC